MAWVAMFETAIYLKFLKQAAVLTLLNSHGALFVVTLYADKTY